MYKQFITGVGHTPEGRLYNNMISRSKKTEGVYKDTTVSENFKDFQYFADWCNKQKGFNCKDENGRSFALDKDLLILDNNQYHEDYCLFLPSEINSFILKGGNENKSNGLPIGICVGTHDNRRGFMSRCSTPFNRKHQKKSGPYSILSKAVDKYKQQKEFVARFLAEKWKDCIDPRAYEMLINFTIEERGYLDNTISLDTTYKQYMTM